jgi:hypothetical protein
VAKKRKKRSPSKHDATVVHQEKRFTVVDDFLAPAELDLVWNFLQAQKFRSVDVFGRVEHWSLEDARARKAPTVAWGSSKGDVRFPTGTPADIFIQAMLAQAEAFEPNVGLPERDWGGLTAAPMLYPRGTGLPWHRDTEEYTGSYTFYAHPRWNIEWGGELMLHAEDDFDRDSGVFFHKLRAAGGMPDTPMTAHLDNEDASRTLMAHGIGSFVMPKPNRLVIIRGGTPHTVARVRDAAGRNVRASISGFFRKAGLD